MIEYAHQRPDYTSTLFHNYVPSTPQATIALEVPTKDLLTKIFLTHSNMTLVDIGLAILSPKDQFSKKVGRDVSTSRMRKQVPIQLLNVSQHGTRHHYEFFIEEFKVKHKTYSIHFQLTTVAESEKVRLIGVQIEECNVQ